MKIKKSVFALLVCSTLAAQSFAYTIYNNTNHSINIKDHSWFPMGGISTTIPAHTSASCNPKARGCTGGINFVVSSTGLKKDFLCAWRGKLNRKERGNYFVISETPNIQYPQPGSCKLEYFHD